MLVTCRLCPALLAPSVGRWGGLRWPKGSFVATASSIARRDPLGTAAPAAWGDLSILVGFCLQPAGDGEL